jgi:hypothetical protein
MDHANQINSGTQKSFLNQKGPFVSQPNKHLILMKKTINNQWKNF